MLKNYGPNTKLVDKQNLIHSELNCIRGIEKPNSLVNILNSKIADYVFLSYVYLLFKTLTVVSIEHSASRYRILVTT